MIAFTKRSYKTVTKIESSQRENNRENTDSRTVEILIFYSISTV